jgi:hypothetical protein
VDSVHGSLVEGAGAVKHYIELLDVEREGRRPSIVSISKSRLRSLELGSAAAPEVPASRWPHSRTG